MVLSADDQMISIFRGWQRHGWTDWHLAMEAMGWLSIVRFLLCFLPFKHVLRWMGFVQGGTGRQEDECIRTGVKAERIGWAVRAAAARTPWQSTCLIQALAGAHMLRRRSLPATLYLGAAYGTTSRDTFEAHAWLSSGDAILTGQRDQERFTVVATFINK
jgi:hypothetical protein